MKSSKHARRDAKALFQACRIEGLLDENRVRQSVDQLLSLKPRGYLNVLGQFQRLVKLDMDRRSAWVDSAEPLSAEDQSKIQNQLTARYGRGLNFHFSSHPALLGGVRIRVGSDVYDGTVQGRLTDLQQSFEAA